MGKFKALNKVVDVKWILKQKDKYAFLFKLVLRNPKLKNDDIVMPVLQFSKCTKIINPVTDNGRIIRCDFCEIAMNEVDLALLDAQYDLSGGAAIFDLYYCHKDYLPRWFTDYVYYRYEDNGGKWPCSQQAYRRWRFQTIHISCSETRIKEGKKSFA